MVAVCVDIVIQWHATTAHNDIAWTENIFKDAFDGKLLCPPYDRNSGYFVLECGTGSGSFPQIQRFLGQAFTSQFPSAAWLLDISKDLPPTALLHGIDINMNIITRPYPSNISFSQCSILNMPKK